MQYRVYKMIFKTAVHFGNGTLESGNMTFYADTYFSALCQEAVKQDISVLNRLVAMVKEDQLRFSDALPFTEDGLFLPKPMMRIQREEESASSVIKKAYKKLKYIPVNSFESYLKGEYDVLLMENASGFGMQETKISVSIRGREQSEPYRVGEYYFHDGNGLYILVAYETEEAIQLVEQLFECLMYSGIGGKRAAGYGRFDLKIAKVPESLRKRLVSDGEKYMSLSVSLPREEELEKVIPDAEYTLCKRSGFVSSETYAEEQMRKRDLYVMKAGSCFRSKFMGDVYDVSVGGKHEVYRYAKPLFMEVGI